VSLIHFEFLLPSLFDEAGQIVECNYSIIAPQSLDDQVGRRKRLVRPVVLSRGIDFDNFQASLRHGHGDF
jgi:hypothetical protein